MREYARFLHWQVRVQVIIMMMRHGGCNHEHDAVVRYLDITSHWDSELTLTHACMHASMAAAMGCTAYASAPRNPSLDTDGPDCCYHGAASYSFALAVLHEGSGSSRSTHLAGSKTF